MLLKFLTAILACLTFNLEAADRQPSCDYSAQMKVEDYTIRVGQIRNQELLAEYRKIVEVIQKGAVIATNEYRDSGGFANFYLLRQTNRLFVVDGLLRGFVLELDSGKTQPVKHANIPSGIDSQSFGRFMFVMSPKRVYKWVKAEDVSK